MASHRRKQHKTIPGKCVQKIAVKHNRDPEVIEKWVFDDIYTIEEFISGGTYGAVCRVTDKSGREFAMKRQEITYATEAKRVGRELYLSRVLDHPNILKLVHMCSISEEERKSFIREVYTITKYYSTDFRSLLEEQQRRPFLTPLAVKKLLYSMMKGLLYLESAKVLHRDIKPSNMLCTTPTGGEVVICDFGLARTDTTAEMTNASKIVTMPYRGPEIACMSKKYDAHVDTWSAGCIFGEAHTGRIWIYPDPSQRHPVHGQLESLLKLIGLPPQTFVESIVHPHVKEFLKMRENETCYERVPFASLSYWQNANVEVPTDLYDLLEGMFQWSRGDRLDNRGVLEHAYFAEVRDVASEIVADHEFPACPGDDEAAGNFVAAAFQEAIYNESLEHNPRPGDPVATLS